MASHYYCFVTCPWNNDNRRKIYKQGVSRKNASTHNKVVLNETTNGANELEVSLRMLYALSPESLLSQMHRRWGKNGLVTGRRLLFSLEPNGYGKCGISKRQWKRWSPFVIYVEPFSVRGTQTSHVICYCLMALSFTSVSNRIRSCMNILWIVFFQGLPLFSHYVLESIEAILTLFARLLNMYLSICRPIAHNYYESKASTSELLQL